MMLLLMMMMTLLSFSMHTCIICSLRETHPLEPLAILHDGKNVNVHLRSHIGLTIPALTRSDSAHCEDTVE
jgi:hypothetical protein